MTSKGPRNPNWPNRWPGNCCYYGLKSKICKKSKINRQKGHYDDFEAKIEHFPAILSQKDQTLYHFQPYDLVQKSPPRTRRWSTGLVAMRHKKKTKKTIEKDPQNDERFLDILELLYLWVQLSVSKVFPNREELQNLPSIFKTSLA